MNDPKVLFWSDHGYLLSHWGHNPKECTIAVELYLKWYTLYVIHPDGTVAPLGYFELDECPTLPKNMSCYVDHTPNPAAVAAYAEWKGWVVCSEAEDLMVGRWVSDVRGHDHTMDEEYPCDPLFR